MNECNSVASFAPFLLFIGIYTLVTLIAFGMMCVEGRTTSSTIEMINATKHIFITIFIIGPLFALICMDVMCAGGVF
jgi:hypothetical protein